MHVTKDWTTRLGAPAQHEGRGRALVGGALALALLGGGVGAALAGDLGAQPRPAAATSDAPVTPDRGSQDTVTRNAGTSDARTRDARTSDAGTRDQPAAPADVDAPDLVPAGTYGARVLGEGWDERGRYVVLDRGRLTDGAPAEPGVDGTRPVVFDTGAVAERRRVDLADGYALRFSRSGGEPSYGSGSWADFVTELSGRDGGMLATVQVDADGRLSSLEEPYRP